MTRLVFFLFCFVLSSLSGTGHFTLFGFIVLLPIWSQCLITSHSELRKEVHDL